MFSKMALYTSSLYTLSTSPKIRVFFKNVWFMSPNQEFTCPRRFKFLMYQNSDKQIIYDFFNSRGFFILISSE